MGFLAGGGLNDVASLRKKIAELQNEIKTLKSKGDTSPTLETGDTKRGGASWLSSTSGGFGSERPTTGSS